MSPLPKKPKVRVVREGFILRRGDEIIDASSTVTLIDADDARIIVDTGSPRDLYVLQDDLRSLKVDVESVDYVINTHMHVDHCGCNDLFLHSKKVAHEAETPPLGTLTVVNDAVLVPGVMVAITPGHTPGSISVFVDSDMRVAVCGDAIPTVENFKSHLPPAVAFDRRLATMSMDRILEWAEVVVPGHGPSFSVVGKK